MDLFRWNRSWETFPSWNKTIDNTNSEPLKAFLRFKGANRKRKYLREDGSGASQETKLRVSPLSITVDLRTRRRFAPFVCSRIKSGSEQVPAFPRVSAVSCISIQSFHYLWMRIISLQMSQLSNVEWPLLLHKQLQPKPSPSRRLHFSLWLRWDFWGLEALPCLATRCSLQAAKPLFLWARGGRWEIVYMFISVLFVFWLGGDPRARVRPKPGLSLSVFYYREWTILLHRS